MESISVPKTFDVYMLLKQSDLMLMPTGFTTGTSSLGTGFFLTEKDAEYQRTLEILKEEKAKYHIFKLTIPNPAYKE